MDRWIPNHELRGKHQYFSGASIQCQFGARIRILTLWQPWASLIALGLKTYETRTWGTNYRGPIAIHAAKRPMDDLAQDVWEECLHAAGMKGSDIELPLGAIVALCRLANCESTDVATLSDASFVDWLAGDFSGSRYAWKLDLTVKLGSPILFKGQQGLRYLDTQNSCYVLSAALLALEMEAKRCQ